MFSPESSVMQHAMMYITSTIALASKPYCVGESVKTYSWRLSETLAFFS